MKSMYEPVNRKKRAANYRRNALECAKAGFEVFAEINAEMAELLDPSRPEIVGYARGSDAQPLRTNRPHRDMVNPMRNGSAERAIRASKLNPHPNAVGRDSYTIRL